MKNYIFWIVGLGILVFFLVLIIILQYILLRNLRKNNRKLKQENCEKPKFVAKLVHDMRTPLNGIIGMTKLTKSRKDKETIEKISASAEYLLLMVNDILDYAKAEAGNIKIKNEPLDLELVAKECLNVLQAQVKEKNINLKFENNLIHKDINSDALRIKQILINVMANAVKFSHNGGNVILKIDEEQELNKSKYIFTIVDEGIGMNEKILLDIFEPFKQADYSVGTGIGLSIVKKLVDLFKGLITVTSKENQGTTFKISLILEWNLDCDKKSIEEIKVLSGKTILLVDDNEINREVASAFLEDVGIKVITAKNGVEAVSAYKKAKQLDCILMDVYMPVMNGKEATRIIRSLDSHIPIIAMSASGDKECIEESLKEGMNDCIEKPFEIKKLYQCILSCCQIKQLNN